MPAFNEFMKEYAMKQSKIIAEEFVDSLTVNPNLRELVKVLQYFADKGSISSKVTDEYGNQVETIKLFRQTDEGNKFRVQLHFKR